MLRLLGDEVGLTSALSKALRVRGFHPDIGVVAATRMQKLDASENAAAGRGDDGEPTSSGLRPPMATTGFTRSSLAVSVAAGR